MTTAPSPLAACPAGQSCAPAGREKKVRKVHIHGKAPTPAGQSRASAGEGAPAAYSAVSILAKAREWQLALGLLSCMAHQLS